MALGAWAWGAERQPGDPREGLLFLQHLCPRCSLQARKCGSQTAALKVRPPCAPPPLPARAVQKGEGSVITSRVGPGWESMKRVRGSSQEIGHPQLHWSGSAGLTGPPALALPWTHLGLQGLAGSSSLATTPTLALPLQAGGNGCVSRRPSTSSSSTTRRGLRPSASVRGSALSWPPCTARMSWTSWDTTCRRWVCERAGGEAGTQAGRASSRRGPATLTCPPGFLSSPGARSSTGGSACTAQRAMGASGRGQVDGGQGRGQQVWEGALAWMASLGPRLEVGTLHHTDTDRPGSAFRSAPRWLCDLEQVA